MATLAEAAAAALKAQRDAEKAASTAARAALIAKVKTLVSGLTGGQVPAASIEVLHVDVASGFAVITDPSRVQLAVTADGRAFLVVQVDGQWQRGEQVETLAELGLILEADA